MACTQPAVSWPSVIGSSHTAEASSLIEDVQIRVARSGGADFHDHLARTRCRIRDLPEFRFALESDQLQRPHTASWLFVQFPPWVITTARGCRRGRMRHACRVLLLTRLTGQDVRGPDGRVIGRLADLTVRLNGGPSRTSWSGWSSPAAMTPSWCCPGRRWRTFDPGGQMVLRCRRGLRGAGVGTRRDPARPRCARHPDRGRGRPAAGPGCRRRVDAYRYRSVGGSRR